MKIVLFCNGIIPPNKYGGTERVVDWLAKGLQIIGHEVTLICAKGSYANEGIKVIEIPDGFSEFDYKKLLPQDFDIVNFHSKINHEPDYRYLHTMHGHPLADEMMPINTNYVSKRHMELYNGRYFIYHGLDLDEYEFCNEKENYFCYLSKINVRYKNLKYALALAKKTGITLKIGGGFRLSFNPKIKYLGMIGGGKKVNLLKNSKGFIFPTLAEESFGLVTIEALACGTPVIVSDKGAQPEIVVPKVGFVCKNEEDYINAIKNIDKINPIDCRKYVEENYSHIRMAENYVKLYENIIMARNNKLL